MNEEATHIINTILVKTQKLISEIEQNNEGTKVVTFIRDGPIMFNESYFFHKLMRKSKSTAETLYLIIDSAGGDLDSTVKIMKIIRNLFKYVKTVVPYYAKSAATYLALAADEIIMGKAGELGPLDPQVPDPVSKMWVPAHSIKEALNFITETKDQVVKLQLADKLPPLLIGAYRDSQNASKQYIEELYSDEEKVNAISEFFAERYLSHGYPIDARQCKEIGLKIGQADDVLENKMYELYDLYFKLREFLNDGNATENKDPDVTIIQSSDSFLLALDNKEISDQLKSADEPFQGKDIKSSKVKSTPSKKEKTE